MNSKAFSLQTECEWILQRDIVDIQKLNIKEKHSKFKCLFLVHWILFYVAAHGMFVINYLEL